MVNHSFVIIINLFSLFNILFSILNISTFLGNLTIDTFIYEALFYVRNYIVLYKFICSHGHVNLQRLRRGQSQCKWPLLPGEPNRKYMDWSIHIFPKRDFVENKILALFWYKMHIWHLWVNSNERLNLLALKQATNVYRVFIPKILLMLF